jgi:hypothetical protein
MVPGIDSNSIFLKSPTNNFGGLEAAEVVLFSLANFRITMTDSSLSHTQIRLFLCLEGKRFHSSSVREIVAT